MGGPAKTKILPLPNVRMLKRTEAAAYAGVSPTTFDRGVRDGSLPPSVRYLGCVRWDLHELDPALDRVGDRLRGGDVSTDNANPWD